MFWFSYPAHLPPSAAFWPWLTRLGEAQLLLPLALLTALWVWRTAGGCRAQNALLRRWLLGLALATALTTASKLAFLGWGLGWARWDFTGFSGHAMFAAAVLPVLAWVALGAGGAGFGVSPGDRTGEVEPRPRRPSVAGLSWGLGLLLAALVAYSRVKVGAHSVSEIWTGYLLGAAASGLALSSAWLRPLRRRLPASLPLMALALLLLLPAWAPKSRSHDWVIHWALQLSGREQPFDRAQLRRQDVPLPSSAPLRPGQRLSASLLNSPPGYPAAPPPTAAARTRPMIPQPHRPSAAAPLQ